MTAAERDRIVTAARESAAAAPPLSRERADRIVALLRRPVKRRAA